MITDGQLYWMCHTLSILIFFLILVYTYIDVNAEP